MATLSLSTSQNDVVCALTVRNGRANWCDRHRMYHEGHYAQYAVDPGEKGRRFRKLWQSLQTGSHVLPAIKSLEKKPLLRSLALAKECRHNAGAIGTKPCCGGCTYYRCTIKGETRLPDCQNCEQWEGKLQQIAYSPKIAIRSPIRFDQHNLAPHHGGARLNPSIIEYKNGYLFAWRNSWARSVTCAIQMDKQFQPFGKVYRINAYHPDAMTCQEDARLFWHQGNLHMWFTGYRKHRGKRIANTLVAKLDNETLRPTYIFHPRIPKRDYWVKNTAFFDHEGELYSIYSIVPHRVHKVYCETVQQTWETPTRTSWKYGHLRGGASPVLHKGQYYHFFHGMMERGGGRLYTIGVAVYEAKPPFRITGITHEPIDIADPKTNPKPGVDVVFPCGAMFVDGQWCVSMGVHDKWSELRFYSENQIEAALSPA